MNEGRNDGKQDPDDNRKAGMPQDDTFEKHAHKMAQNFPSTVSWNEFINSSDKRDFKPVSITVSPYTNADEAKNVEVAPKGDVETRPKNVAVYFYLKIN